MRCSAFLSAALALAGSAAAKGPYVDFRAERPGARHLIRPADMPAPYATPDARNPSEFAPRPAGLLPRAPAGWRVSLYASGLDVPRIIHAAPDGDLFVTESLAGRVRVLRGVGRDGKAEESFVFASGLHRPFGIGFFPTGKDPRWVYVGDTDAVLRFPYRRGDTKARGPAETLMRLPTGGHWTRDLAFSEDGKTLFVSVGSRSNVADVDRDRKEAGRAVILAAGPDGRGARVYASGLRNAVALAVDPATGRLWATVNERDRLGDDLPPDFLTRVRKGGFYGWPWFYIGAHEDPRLAGRHPELAATVLVPDVLLQPHCAPLGLAFRGGYVYVALHGSWNRSTRTGYEVARVRVRAGKPEPSYEDFLTGFVLPDGRVWGRPVGATAGADGALYVTDDASGSVWRAAP